MKTIITDYGSGLFQGRTMPVGDITIKMIASVFDKTEEEVQADYDEYYCEDDGILNFIDEYKVDDDDEWSPFNFYWHEDDMLCLIGVCTYWEDLKDFTKLFNDSDIERSKLFYKEFDIQTEDENLILIGTEDYK